MTFIILSILINKSRLLTKLYLQNIYMAEAKGEYTLGTPQEHASMCEKHHLMPIEIICEDCEEFICSKCVKEDHKDHNWNTIVTAATLKARGLMKFMKKIEEEDIKQIDERIKMAAQMIEANNKKYEIEIAKIQRHYDTMVGILNNSKEKLEQSLRRNLDAKNAGVREIQSNLEEKKKNIIKRVECIKKNGSTMHDEVLLKSHRELTRLIASVDHISEPRSFKGKYESGNIDEEVLKSMMGIVRFPLNPILVYWKNMKFIF